MTRNEKAIKAAKVRETLMYRRYTRAKTKLANATYDYESAKNQWDDARKALNILYYPWKRI